MPKKLQKSLQDCLSKIKQPTPHIQFPSNSFSSSKNWILRGCKHPKTRSFSIDSKENQAGTGEKDEPAATLADVDRFLFENFKSLYLHDDDDKEGENDKKLKDHNQENEIPNRASYESFRFLNSPPDLRRSRRFSSISLIASDDIGSNSTSETSPLNETTTISDDRTDVTLPDDCIALLTYSPSPGDDFRRSMREMVEARLDQNGRVDWDFMEELLFCYLNLNEKKSHKFILGAFVDLVVVLRRNSDEVPARSRGARNERERGKMREM